MDTPQQPDRRAFFQTTALGAGALALPAAAASAEPPATPAPAGVPDFTRGSSALEPDRIVASACQFCNSLCGLKVGLKAGRVIDITGRADDPVQAGGLCVKGPMMAQLVYNRHRLKTPLRRVAGAKGDPASKFEPITWDDALSLVARKFLALRDAGEARAVVSRTSGRLPRGTGSLIHRLFTLLGSPNDTDVGPVCNDAGGNALAVTFGLGNFTNGYGVDPATGREDLGAAKFFLFLGTNQAETHPVTFAHLLRCREKTRAKLMVVDPRKTATGAVADVWIAPKPHTDLALVLGVLGHIVERKLYDAAFVEKWVLGFDELARHLTANGYAPAWAARVCDVPERQVVELAEGYAKAKPAAIFCNAGISHQLNAFDTYRALAMLAAVTGNIGVPGGGCNFMHNTWPGDLHLPPSGVKPPELPDKAMPVGPDWFAESVLSGRPYRMKALVSMGNPLLSSANTAKVKEAFGKLEFFAYTGLFLEESAYYADVVLPVCSGLEMDGVYMRRDDRGVRWQTAAVPRVGESKPDWEIWIDLAHALAKHDAKNRPAYWTDAFPAGWKDYRTLWAEFVRLTPGMGGMTAERMAKRAEPLRWPCPTEGHPGVSTLYLDHPTWSAAAASLGQKGKRFLTPSGKVEVFTPELEKRLAPAGHGALPAFYTHPEVTGRHPTVEYAAELVSNPVNPQAVTPTVRIGVRSDGRVHAEYPLMGMIGRPSVVHFAGVTQWTYTGKQLNGVRLVQVHPKTAAAAGLKTGDPVVVESPRGSVSGTVLVWDGIRGGTRCSSRPRPRGTSSGSPGMTRPTT
ncbi:MAG: anaerobic dehydrogenase, typically selenocysteine-containing [Gemmataceae bacterium]|nr:anaerobic dehydrogenase, typically selenocysteine-containing [Gemmataceae bacterium]